MPPAHRRPGLAPVALALLGLQCARPPQAPHLERLWPALGAPAFVRLDDESRPAVRLSPGEPRSADVSLEPGSQLVFAVGLERPPSRGFLQLSVTANGVPVFDERFSLARTDHWWHRSVTLKASGPVRLEFKGRHVRGEEAPVDGGRADWIALASPRVYRPKRPARRTLLWISQDALRADHLGSYGYARPTSPRFDRMARDYAVFERAVAACSWTLPSLASQFTSRYPTYHGARLHNLPVSRASRSLFEALSESGFTVLGVTGNDLVSPALGLARGFDALWFADGRGQDLAARLEAALGEWGGGDVALFVHLMDPHAPYVPPASYERLFRAERSGQPIFTDFTALSRIQEPAQVEQVKALYDAEIAYNDDVIADLVERLASRGLGPAVIVYSADHGEELRDHGSWHHGGTLYEEVLHVPLAIRVPGSSGRRIPQPVSLVDLAPTVLEALGLPIASEFQGRSLLPLIRGASLPEAPCYAETELTQQRHQLVAVREGRFKYIVEVPRGIDLSPTILSEQLYDLELDPAEMQSRAGGPQGERLRRFALAYLAKARSQAGPATPVDLDPRTLERLKALGYVK